MDEFLEIEAKAVAVSTDDDIGADAHDTRDIAAGTMVTETRWIPIDCRGSVEIRIGYEQPDEPSQMPFMPGGRNAKVGRATVRLSGG